MKYNKVAVILRNGLFILLMIAGISSFAQKKTPEERARMVTDSMKTTLTLSDDQYQKAYNANLSFMSGAASLKAQEGDKASKISKLKSLNKEHDSALKSILNDEQYNLYKDQKKDNRKQMRGRLKSRR